MFLHDIFRKYVDALLTFYAVFLTFYFRARPYNTDFPYTLSTRARVFLYGWSVTFLIWDQPHYRNGTFADDMKKNLRNVALPGTGIALSTFVQYGRFIAVPAFLILYPMVCIIAAMLAQREYIIKTMKFDDRAMKSVAEEFKLFLNSYVDTFVSYLLEPEDWFSLWQLNCRLASFHALIKDRRKEGYLMEDKHLFTEKALKENVPVVPSLRLPASSQGIVMKDRNEEGGMGLQFFSVAGRGTGRWICQPAIHNSTFVSSLLPKGAPLSTFRVITCSRLGGLPEDESKAPIQALSCTFRAGRAGKATDHSGVLFDCSDGVFQKGTTNWHWYRLGIWNQIKSLFGTILSLQDPYSLLFSMGGEHLRHPDKHPVDGEPALPGIDITDKVKAMKLLCEEAHKKLLPDVPLAGWDVAWTDDDLNMDGWETLQLKEEYPEATTQEAKAGTPLEDRATGSPGTKEKMVLLETNLSCNFFRGQFDNDVYFKLMDDYFSMLDGANRSVVSF